MCPESGTEDFILLYQRCGQCQLRVMLGSCKECQNVRRDIMDRSFPSQGRVELAVNSNNLTG